MTRRPRNNLKAKKVSPIFANLSDSIHPRKSQFSHLIYEKSKPSQGLFLTLFGSIYIYFQYQKPFCKVSGAEIEYKNPPHKLFWNVQYSPLFVLSLLLQLFVLISLSSWTFEASSSSLLFSPLLLNVLLSFVSICSWISLFRGFDNTVFIPTDTEYNKYNKYNTIPLTLLRLLYPHNNQSAGNATTCLDGKRVEGDYTYILRRLLSLLAVIRV